MFLSYLNMNIVLLFYPPKKRYVAYSLQDTTDTSHTEKVYFILCIIESRVQRVRKMCVELKM